MGAAAVAALALALLARRPSLVAVAAALVGGQYSLLLAVESPALDTRAAVVAAALYVVAELGYWGVELRGAVADEPGMLLRRVAVLCATAVGVAVFGIALLTLVETVGRGGRVLEAAGVAAAVGVLALVVLAARAGPREG
ncbi:MAG TPA: hypothetical protein VNT58_02490 [Gaiellaceae bacterium]|nr:hypothetical protein [Gaiellaceae bacterium]